MVRRHLDDWELERDGDVLFGYTAIVVPVRHIESPRERRALKVRWLDPSTEQEALALRTWDGQGAVRLIAEDASTGALLLERLDPDTSLRDAPESEAVDVVAALLRRLAVPAPVKIRPIAREVAEMTEELPRRWEQAGGPIPRTRLDRLLGLAGELADTDARLMVNSDLHYENVLAGTREPWLAIDPKVVAGDLEYAVAQLLWNRAAELSGAGDLRVRLERIADRADLDLDRARRWSVVRLAENLVWSRSVGQRNNAENCHRLLGWLDWEQLLGG